eukprot:gnl/MRDRNA2_/MRDRNA2_168561_c0_seq1.p1 gnl/MRDRNA2_/MRDRNA2_168561_c0~~gnl/MRDRNA2_/MRDRNA2_168561_c0_seq1.p1  ORF type:complete len:252 (-),score=30.35 gnl/MRDRNA2_/MRDRNA2_168561_c0_seq1:70-825(-)
MGSSLWPLLCLTLWKVGVASSAETINDGDASVAKQGSMDDVLIEEYNDPSMGVAFTMVDDKAWASGKWGFLNSPTGYTDWAQTFVSIMTQKTPMKVYKGRSYGLTLHIAPSSDTWKYFEVIGRGEKAGNIVGGPGDGGSHTPGDQSDRLSPQSQGKDYTWFKSQKDGILAKYNTVYGIGDYNEFITNGLPKSAVAGIFRYTLSSEPAPTDEQMCHMLRFQRTTWPIYAYDRKSLTIERYLDCSKKEAAILV